MKLHVLAHFFNALLLLWLIAAAGFLASELQVVTIFAALVTLGIAFFVFKRQRWGYFSAAAWGLACYQLAKEELAFEVVKRPAMLGGFAVVVIALVLHEVFCRRPTGERNNPM
ncbi:hypothetical protein QWI17_22145 [Gilvimarinus sp. SDUM040013]|uniref:Uncharacterized protein n=1 Tax=Gilvimarinus gilvus TaxID=3058038 RepID=A0ABU4RUK6_9GAMM|nr:hypothetical protein [Gilvimarinus sp. SDUM040013]MDO3388565.1 hypothetical protein [Gilvimarinus sp. SDUM040013]MDX6848563.1 hypothetical protein [Gilvimarinus sp. SDUM040013]